MNIASLVGLIVFLSALQECQALSMLRKLEGTFTFSSHQGRSVFAESSNLQSSASSLEESTTGTVFIEQVDGIADHANINMNSMAKFMLDSFWLPQISLLPEVLDSTSREKLILEIEDDLTQRYSPLMGKRKFDSCLLAATSQERDIIGCVGVDVTLFDKVSNLVIPRVEAERKLTNAFGAIGPKQRRQFKDATIHELIPGLLPPEFSACAVLSNLAVSLDHRRKGVGQMLCEKVEYTIKEEWGFDEILLRVEASNLPARRLYEDALQYKCIGTDPDAVAYRVDPEEGKFNEIASETLLLSKRLE